jgi:transcriptional regulator with XRE-family HTH domain
MHIGQVIYALRQERQLTQEKLALEVDTATSNLSRIEQGKSSPSLALLERLARALDTSVTAIYAEAEGFKVESGTVLSVRETHETDYSREALQLRQGFRDLSPANQKLALEFMRLLSRLEREADSL